MSEAPSVESSSRLRSQPARPAAVSVIIPCYNQAHFLADSIESVLDQTYRAFELLVVDDGSTDDTGAVASRYPGVGYLLQGNQGLSAARNAGLNDTTGEFVVFLDADDRLLPNALEAGLKQLQTHPACGFVVGQYYTVGADGSFLAAGRHQSAGDDQYAALLRGNFIRLPASVIYRRSVLEVVGAFDASCDACEDYDLYLRVSRQFPIACHEEIVAEYRQHDASMSGNAARMLISSHEVLRRQRAQVRGNKSHERALRRGVRVMRECHGRLLTKIIRADIENRRWSQALVGSLVLIRYAPACLLEVGEQLPLRFRCWFGSRQ